MMIFRYILLYIIILSFSLFIADLGNKKLEKTIPLSLVSIIFVLYLFGIVNLLLIGIYVIIIASMLLLIYTIFKNVKNHTMKKLKEKVISVGTLFFSIVFFLFMIATFNRQLVHWDQFSYWSIAAKEMFYTNDLLITAENIIAQYPPAPTLLQYFFMKVIGQYIQGVEAFAIWLLSISFFLPFFEKSKGKKLANIMISVLILCVPAIFYLLNFYESSYPDVLLGILIGYLSYSYFCEKNTKWKTISIMLTFMLLTLTKPIGVVISLILLMTFILFEFITQRKKKKKLKDRIFSQEFKTIALFLVAIIITYMSWTIYAKIERKDRNLQNDASVINREQTLEKVTKSLFTTVLGVGQENINEAQSNGNLIHKLYQTIEINTPIKISAAGLICIFILITVVYYEHQKEPQEKQQTKHIALCLLIGLVLYTGALQFAYLTQFSTKEMVNHDGMERYIGAYLLGILYVMMAYSLDKIKAKNKNVGYLLLMSIIIMITPIYSVVNATITSGICNLDTIYEISTNKMRASEIQKIVANQEKILGIYQESDRELEHLMIRYYLYPTCYYVKKIEKMDELKQWIAKKQYHYLYVMNIEEELIKQLENEFSIKIENDTLFKITDQGLEKIK